MPPGDADRPRAREASRGSFSIREQGGVTGGDLTPALCKVQGLYFKAQVRMRQSGAVKNTNICRLQWSSHNRPSVQNGKLERS